MTKEFLARDGVIVPLAAPVNGPLSLPQVPSSLLLLYKANKPLVLEPCFSKATMSFQA